MCVRIKAYLRNSAGLITDYLDKVSIVVRQVVSFLLVDSLAFNLLKKKKATFMKCNKVKCDKTRYVCMCVYTTISTYPFSYTKICLRNIKQWSFLG